MINLRYPKRNNVPAPLAVFLVCIFFCAPLSGLVIDRSDYAERLRAYWLGVSLANWTGLRTENVRPGWNAPLPLYTSADWGTYDAVADRGDHRNGWINWVFPEDVPGGDPNTWGADDDTDIEYMYLHLLNEHGTTTLTGEQIREGWLKHMDTNPNGTTRFLWVSNPEVDDLHVEVQQWTESGGWQTTHENPVRENGYVEIIYPAETSGLFIRLVLSQ